MIEHNQKTTELVAWFRSRPAISVNMIEKELGLPATAIAAAMSGKRNIPKKHIAKIEAHLVRYGRNG